MTVGANLLFVAMLSLVAFSSSPVGAQAPSGPGSHADVEVAHHELPPLTPIGAERAGSRDGTIPVWAGGIQRSEWPNDYTRGGPYKDPFAGEQPLFVITSQNIKGYDKYLSEGHKALLRRYPSYRLPVYPTHRIAAYPEEVYDGTQENAKKARLVGVDAVKNVAFGFPFPGAKSGAEVLWNHRLRYRGNTAQWSTRQSLVNRDGSQRVLSIDEWSLYRYADRGGVLARPKPNVLHYRVTRLNPIGRCGMLVWLWHEPLNATQEKRNNWARCSATRNFRLAFFGHNDISIGSNGVRYFDMLDMFTGEFDRYTFRLIGKRPMVIAYNSYRLLSGEQAPERLFQKNHMDTSHVRYEMHRVWVVEATLRQGQTHDLAKRVFYLDEDSWSIALVDLYDKSNRLVRAQEGHLTPLYEAQLVEAAPQVVYDLVDGRYFVDRAIEPRRPPQINVTLKPVEFTPSSLPNFLNR